MSERELKLKETIGIYYNTTCKKKLRIWNKFLKAIDKAYCEAYEEYYKMEESRWKEFRKKFGPPPIIFQSAEDKPSKRKKPKK